MRAYVWTDKALTRHAGRFVWLSLDMEQVQNAAARRQLRISAFPTLYVVDPADGHVAIRWLGEASIAQLERLFDDGELAVKGGARGPALEALVAADRAYGAENFADACSGYRAALAVAPADWPARARCIESLMFAYSQADSNAASLLLADTEWPRARGSTSAAIVAGWALNAAVRLPDTLAIRKDWLARYEAACHEVLADATLPLVGDDRSELYFSLEDARSAAGDSLGVRALREQHVAMLQDEARRARSAEQRAVYDSHRTTLYIALGRPDAAIAMLQQSQRDFPDDYNPPQRLASAYRAMKLWPEALAASDRALARAYGPRQFIVLNTRADIQLGMGDKAAAIATLTEALGRARKMPDGQRSENTTKSLQKRLAGLTGTK